ncbi:hypothetical protein [Paucibacter soli]|uniref:hypothetical protein n=1 Tax=Paucibacter soli TaxID=3133433 RepID=UPI0030A13433
MSNVIKFERPAERTPKVEDEQGAVPGRDIDTAGMAEYMYGRTPAGKRWVLSRKPDVTPNELARCKFLSTTYLFPNCYDPQMFLRDRTKADMDRLLDEGGIPPADRTPERLKNTWFAALMGLSPTVEILDDEGFGFWEHDKKGAQLRWCQAVVENDPVKAIKAWPAAREAFSKYFAP